MVKVRRWLPLVVSLLGMGLPHSVVAKDGVEMPVELSRSGLLTLSSDRAVNRIAAKLRRSRCGKAPEIRAGMVGIQQTNVGAFSVVERGKSSSGTVWFALRSESFPDPPLCAVAVAEQEQGTVIRLYGVASRHSEAALKAVHRGDLFCRCKALRD